MPYFYLPSRRIRKESLSLLVCFVIAVGLNVYAIIHYEAPLSELWTSILYVLMATVVFYAVWILLRLLIYGFLCLIGKQPKNKHRHHYIIHRHQRGHSHHSHSSHSSHHSH